MYTEEDLSLEMLLFKYLKTQVSRCIKCMYELNHNEKDDKYCSHFVVNTNGHHQQYIVLEFYSSGRKLKSKLKLELLMDQDVA